MKYRHSTLLLCLLFVTTTTALGQTIPNVLFIGNSYTQVNNLPQMTTDVARSLGHEMLWSSNTPGGCTFSQHCTNQSMTLICNGGWDFVVLQEQSQYPSFPQSQVEAEVFPYAARLVDSVYAVNPCAEPMFYMTWGRKNGDADNAPVFPVLGTYEGMDSMLYLRYMQMAADNDASVCPVGRVWRNLRDNHPEIELYQSDGSHPSIAGTYAAACAFAVMFFGDDPTNISYIPPTLNPQVAETIRQAVKKVVYNHLTDWQRKLPQVTVEVESINGLDATFIAHPTHTDTLVWDFGDGTTASTTDSLVSHTYADSGDYTVTLVATRHCLTDTALLAIHITTSDLRIPTSDLRTPTSDLTVYPNPTAVQPTITLDGQPISHADSEITLTAPDGRRYNLLQFNNLPVGIYMVHLVHHNQIHRGKIIKQ
jgi:hypothetical protein